MGEKLKVLQVVTLITEKNKYGGPASVALDIHNRPPLNTQIETYSTREGKSRSPSLDIQGLQLFSAFRLLPISKFSVLVSFGMLRSFVKHSEKWDLVHIHLSRDLITLPVAIICSLRKIPFIIHSHGMLETRHKILASMMDKLFLKRIVQKAHKIVFLTNHERQYFQENFSVGTDLLAHLPNSVPSQLPKKKKRADVFTVLFAARLHKRKRPVDFLRIAATFNQGNVQFRMIGADDGELESVLEYEKRTSLTNFKYLGQLTRNQVIENLAAAHILVLPSENEPYPVSVLESISVGTPVVVTKSCGLAREIQMSGSGMVVDVGQIEQFENAINAISENWIYYSENSLRASELFSRDLFNEKLGKIYGGRGES